MGSVATEYQTKMSMVKSEPWGSARTAVKPENLIKYSSISCFTTELAGMDPLPWAITCLQMVN